MTTHYNQVAGQSLHRLEGLSDGVFAFAMTLLVLDLRPPESISVHSEADLWRALVALGPRVVTWLLSFFTLGIFWVGQQTHHECLSRADRGYTWINLLFLMLVSLVPFSTALLSEFIAYRVALLVYWFNLLMLGLILLAATRHARTFGLLKPDTPADVERAILRRLYVSQALYAVGAGLCIVSTGWSIAFIFAVQIILAIGLRFRPFRWL